MNYRCLKCKDILTPTKNNTVCNCGQSAVKLDNYGTFVITKGEAVSQRDYEYLTQFNKE